MLKTEKEKYNDIYTNLVFAADDLKQIIEPSEIKKRSFIIKLDTLTKYISFLDELEIQKNNKNKGFFSKIFKSDDDIDCKIQSYLTKDKLTDLTKLKLCSQCKCISCTTKCPMNQCLNCRDKEFVSNCNQSNATLTHSQDTVTLYSDETEFIFDLKATLLELDHENRISRYVYLIDRNDPDNQHILVYSKFKGEESYDSLIEDDSQDELVRINDLFIELGLIV